jgi:hypothetical protein
MRVKKWMKVRVFEIIFCIKDSWVKKKTFFFWLLKLLNSTKLHLSYGINNLAYCFGLPFHQNENLLIYQYYQTILKSNQNLKEFFFIKNWQNIIYFLIFDNWAIVQPTWHHSWIAAKYFHHKWNENLKLKSDCLMRHYNSFYSGLV